MPSEGWDWEVESVRFLEHLSHDELDASDHLADPHIERVREVRGWRGFVTRYIDHRIGVRLDFHAPFPYLYLEGPPAERPRCWPAKADRGAYTVWHEVVLRPGEQHLVPPNTLHWFQAGPDGAIVSEFSTQSRDDLDVFTDPDIARTTVVTSNWVSAGGEGEDPAAAAHR
jgi:hypothetical protein